MDGKWIQILLVLVLYQKMSPGAGYQVVKDGEPVDITCEPPTPHSTVLWFRVTDKVEFIASFSTLGAMKANTPLLSSFIYPKIQQNILRLKSFSRATDSGVYSCVCIRNNELSFGKATRLMGEPVPVTMRAPQTTATLPAPTTAPACVCKEETSAPMTCPVTILGPLAGGCGLLLLLLIITVLYCNRIRTRRCPHHNRRRPRISAAGKQMMTNRHI